MRNIIKCLIYSLGSLKTGVKWFLRKDPPFYELARNYEENHETSYITFKNYSKTCID